MEEKGKPKLKEKISKGTLTELQVFKNAYTLNPQKMNFPRRKRKK